MISYIVVVVVVVVVVVKRTIFLEGSAELGTPRGVFLREKKNVPQSALPEAFF